VPGLEPKLLKLFSMLIQHKSVTKAAEQLYLSQSAVSKQLAKLRQIFDDPLFEHTSFGLQPTPKAKQLAPKLKQIGLMLEQVLQPEDFNPSLCQRTFEIELLETAYTLTFPHILPELLQQAPELSLNLNSWNNLSMQKLLDCELDLGICCLEYDPRSSQTMRQLPPNINSVELSRENSVALVREDHPLLTQDWGLDTFLAYGHINLLLTGIQHWLLDDVLAEYGRYRQIQISLADAFNAMDLCQRSELILCMPARYANNMLHQFKLKLLPIPVAMQPGSYVLAWHQHFEQDSAHQWLRQKIISSCQQFITLD